MDVICLSAASIIRCAPLTQFENQVLIIPTGLEALCAVWLIVSNWGKGWRHLLLAAEAFTYLSLALIDLLSHTIPAAREQIGVFKIIDIVLASACFLPILFYLLFLFLFSSAETLTELPRRLRMVTKLLLFLFIPIIVATNEVSSFIGITHRYLPSPDGRPLLSIGFNNDNDRSLWMFFTSLNLALLTVVQALNFLFTCYRLLLAVVDQRRIEVADRDERRFYNGTGWIALGIKVGAVETAIGFASPSFGYGLARRILRFVSRAILTFGVTRGVDVREDFQQVQDEMRRTNTNMDQRKSVNPPGGLRALISRPLSNTFYQLSPNPNRRMSQLQRQATLLNQNQQNEQQQPPRNMSPSQSIQYFSSARRNPRDRVTVHFAPDMTPSLEMRFSALELPDPKELVRSIKARSEFEDGEKGDKEYESSFYAAVGREYAPSPLSHRADSPPPPPQHAPPATTLPTQPPPIQTNMMYQYRSALSLTTADNSPEDDDPTAFRMGNGRRQRIVSTKTLNSFKSPDSEKAITELVGQFPRLPTRVSLSSNGPHRGVKETLRGIGQMERGQDAYPTPSSPASDRTSSSSASGSSIATPRLRPPPSASIPVSANATSPKSEWIDPNSPTTAYRTSNPGSLPNKFYPDDIVRPDSGIEMTYAYAYADDGPRPDSEYHDPGRKLELVVSPDVEEAYAGVEGAWGKRRSSGAGSGGSDNPFADADEDEGDGDGGSMMGSAYHSSVLLESSQWIARKMTPIVEESERSAAASATSLNSQHLHLHPSHQPHIDTSTSSPLPSPNSSASTLAFSEVQRGYRAPRKTPTIVRRGHTRGSIAIEPITITIPPGGGGALSGIMVVGGGVGSETSSLSEYSTAGMTGEGGHEGEHEEVRYGVAA